MLVRKTKPLPVECVVRGYLAGSGWREYRERGTICGISLPAGLVEADMLPEPVFTPATKAASGHDENITHEQASDLILRTAGMRTLAFGHADFGSNRLVEPIQGMTGHHRPHGVLLLHGPGVSPGIRLEGASILDVAPTVLWLMGQPVPAAMDGAALRRAFTPQWQAAAPLETVDRPIDRDADDGAYSAEDEETIRERLKGLGYAG